jgi:hypothetical protein
MLALFSLFYRNGNRRATHSGKDASLPGKVSVGTALFPVRQKNHSKYLSKEASAHCKQPLKGPCPPL